MKKTFKKVLLLFSIILLTTCSYEFSDDYYKDIQIENPNASLSLINFTDGEIFKQSESINFVYSGNDKHRLFLIQIFIDDQIKLSTNDISGSFSINAHQLSEGEHSLKIEYSFSSGTGSLADMNNLEGYFVTETFNFYIDKSIADAFSLTEVKIEDGTINVYWEEVLDYNFESAYIIVKNNNREIKRELLTKDKLQSGKYNDDFSVSGELTYQIILCNAFDSVESNVLLLENIVFPTPTYKIINERSAQITIDKHLLYNNFDNYQFASSLNNNQNIEVSNLGDTITINFEPKNRLDTSFYSRFILYKDDNYIDSINFYINWGNKFDLTNPIEIIYDKKTNSYYALDLDGSQTYQSPRKVVIHKLSNEDLSITKSSELLTVYEETSDLTLDPSTGNLIVDLENTSLIVDINNLAIIKQYNSEDFLSSDLNSNKVMYRNGKLFVNVLYKDKTNIYNADTKELLHSIDIRYTELSDNGNYLWDYGSTIYKVEDANMFKVYTIPENGYIANFKFIDGQNSCVYNRYNAEPYLLDLTSMSKVKLSNSIEVRRFEFDNASNKVLLRFYGTASLIDLDTQKTYDFIYNSDNEHRGYNLKILNNKLITSKGYYLDYFEE